ncbi:MAG: glycosyltransferase family 39 protein [Candidatus Bathyarchaeota archaeon]|nr:glycosyltransferase family 39 protein [Candidatus Bathyarchaeota archaeon]
MTAQNFKAFLLRHYPLIGVLIGALLLLLSIGEYHNWDSDLEFEAAGNVLSNGFPLVNHNIINQPPLGFYINAPIFAISGLNYHNAISIQIAFALGCITLLYAAGTLLYGRRTGLAAAALFAVVPWQVYISKIFLIDVKALFFSLLFLIVAVYAVRRNSERLVLAAGAVFGIALLTKLYAVFMLVPIALLLFLNRQETDFRLSTRKLWIFLAPIALLQFVWYGIFFNSNFLNVYFSTDFGGHLTNSSPTYLLNLLVQSGGWFLWAATIFSLVLTACFWRFFAGLRRMDLVCFGTVAVICSIDLLFAMVFGWPVPYISSFKYLYFAVPFFCLLAASLAAKSSKLIALGSKGSGRKTKIALAGFGAVLLVVSLFENALFIIEHPSEIFIRLDSFNYFPLYQFSPAIADHQNFAYLGTATIILSLLLPLIMQILKREG